MEAVSDDVPKAIERKRSDPSRERDVARDVEAFGIAEIHQLIDAVEGKAVRILKAYRRNGEGRRRRVR